MSSRFGRTAVCYPSTNRTLRFRLEARPSAPARFAPVLLLDRVTAPLLLLHGTDDRVVPVWLAEQLFTGLRRLDRPVALARYSPSIPGPPLAFS